MKIPKKVNLANIPTPIEELSFEGKKFLIKRDDLTGVELSGNKVRKLEYLLYDALHKKSDYIFTCGGDQSNHARATVIAAAKLGMKTKLFLWGRDTNVIPEGNLFIDKFIGAEIKYLHKNEFLRVNDIMYYERQAYSSKGLNVYAIPAGGSSTLGIWGYIAFIGELREQINIHSLEGIYAACGSGGTAAGLLVGLALYNLNIKVYAVNVLSPSEEMRKTILLLAKACTLDYKIECTIDPDNLVILDGYSSEGYKDISKDKVKLIKNFAQSTGIILDPAYTGKAFNAYYDNVLSNYSGKQNLFLHTGGLFGVFDKRKEYLAL